MKPVKETKATRNYDQFVFLSKNRASIRPAHVKRLIESIKARNLLHLRPIDVNSNMEILDGQHRLLAAKELGLEIYYNVVQDYHDDDIILMNVHLNWDMNDYLNYYLKKHHPEYIKLDKFMKDTGLKLQIALRMIQGNGLGLKYKFRHGEFKFPEGDLALHIDNCHQTMDLIKRYSKDAHWLRGTKFWMALVRLVSHENFDMTKWEKKIAMFSHKWGPRSTLAEYWDMLLKAYNYRNTDRIIDEIKEEESE